MRRDGGRGRRLRVVPDAHPRHGPVLRRRSDRVRRADLELAVAQPPLPDVPLHLKVDTGMGRRLARAADPLLGIGSRCRGRTSIPSSRSSSCSGSTPRRPSCHSSRRTSRTAQPRSGCPALASAARWVAAVSPFGGRSRRRRARAGALLAQRARPGEAARGAKARATAGGSWPSSRRGSGSCRSATMQDGFRRDLTGTEVLVDGERRRGRNVSMDSFAVELPGRLPKARR